MIFMNMMTYCFTIFICSDLLIICFLTGKILWGKHAYHGARLIMGPGEHIYDQYWVEKNEFIITRLKGKI